ncbi:uncharacterized protein LOC116430665 isoform X2 [Nomia melanderi]|uniref:uncharacterized protein LOC116430665 isoform X2 n=1 Tax=Nomia melanderi TaxID=2448451 RepID=UPI0013041F4B|nr:serine/threonine-protein phosphatase 4 regulatory subunit 4-like isoform X2 [Nomia melanderi]
MLQEEDKAPYESVPDPKGDDFQKLSVIQNLPSLLQTDTQSCMSRVVPKMQQSLATASTEFHIAASSTFKTILEQKLVSHNVFSQTFLPSILNSLESRDPDTIKTIIVPLVKKLCENALKSEDNVICVIAQEFGKLVLGLEKCLVPAEKTWFLKYFQQLAQMGIVSIKKESKPHLPFMNTNPAEDEKHMECRRCCAFNLPAMFLFVSNSSDDTDALLVTFNALASDHYYMVRKTVASGIHEVAKVLGPKSGRIKTDLIKLLKDDSEEVLQGLVPHIGLTLDCLAESQTIGVDRVDSTLMEIGRALLKCESEISATHNWRLASMMHAQLEIIPKYFPSDFIYSYFVPMAFFRILHARPIPVRLAAGTLYLFLLRYNMKPMQRIELRSRLYTELANSPDCYVRMMFVRMMIEALEIFSSVYFKEHFFTVLLNLAEDPVANIRIKVVSLLPQLKSQLWIPTDKKLLSAMETTVGHLMNSEKDRDVIAILTTVVRKLNDIELKYESQTTTAKHSKQDIEDAKKLEEEKRLSEMVPGKSPAGGATMKKGAWRRPGDNAKPTSQTPQKGPGSPRHTSESSRMSSMPEIPVMLSDDEFLVDAGIRIPAQFSASQGASKIPHLQDFFAKRRRSFNFERSRSMTMTMSFDKGRPKRNSSVEYEDCMKRRTNGDQSSNSRTSIDCEEGLRLVKESQQITKKDTVYVGSLMRSRFGFGVNQERSGSLDEKMKRNSLILDKDKPKVLQSKCSLDRIKRHSASFEKGKPKRNSSVDFEDSMKRSTNGANQSKDLRTSSIDYEDGLRLVKTDEQLDKKDSVYLGSSIRATFGFVNRERPIDDKMKRNSLILDKEKPKLVHAKCTLDRTKRHSASFEKGKPKRNLSADYEDSMKRRTNGASPSKDLRTTSIDYEDGLRLVKDDQQLDQDELVYLGPLIRSRFGFVNQERPMDDEMKRNSSILDKEKPKLVHTKCTLDRTKRHSANFSLKPTDSKEPKPNLKCHSLEMSDYAPSERLGRALRRYSTLDVNHNQGLSKIPLRSFVPRSRTAPATRASSPVHIEKLCRMPFWES